MAFLSLSSTNYATLLVLLFLNALFPSVHAQIPSSGFTIAGGSQNYSIAVNVPSNSANSLNFHFTSDLSNGWNAFGFGSQMAGSLIFIAYASANGKNITISPRLGLGEFMPQYTSNVQVTLLEGSGVVNGQLVANFMCTNCRSWSGGSVNVNSNSQPMIWSMGPGQQVQSDNLQLSLIQHSNRGVSSVNLQQATGQAGVPSSSSASSNTSTASNDGPSLLTTHVVLMGITFLFLFPTGYLLLRLLEKVWIHYGIQSTALLLGIAGMGVGVRLSKSLQIYPNLTHPHQIIGFVVIGLGFSAWVIGLTGHIIFRRTGKPATIMMLHRLLGPSTLLLGFANGIVGFNLSGDRRGMVAWIIIMCVVIVIVGVLVYFKQRSKMRNHGKTSPAAQNFREGHSARHYGAEPTNDQNIPLQSYNDYRR